MEFCMVAYRCPSLLLRETDCSVVEDNLTLCEEFLCIRDKCCVYLEKSNLEKKDNTG